MRNRPTYFVQSVDHALLILQLLRDTGRLSVSDTAQELGTARSTAHRLLSMLVYRGFAVQDDDRAYRPGPSLTATGTAGEGLLVLRRVVTPHLEALCAAVRESVNLSIRLGTEAHFLRSVECTQQLLRVGNRQGTVLPAALTSGGRALLAELPPDAIGDLYAAAAPDKHTDLAALAKHLKAARRRGYAINEQETEVGVCAIATCLRDGTGQARAAMAVAVPHVRFTRERLPQLVAALAEFAGHATADLKTIWPPTTEPH